MLLPRQSVPALNVPAVAHGEFKLTEDAARNFTLVAALDSALAENYPARGECAGVV